MGEVGLILEDSPNERAPFLERFALVILRSERPESLSESGGPVWHTVSRSASDRGLSGTL